MLFAAGLATVGTTSVYMSVINELAQQDGVVSFRDGVVQALLVSLAYVASSPDDREQSTIFPRP